MTGFEAIKQMPVKEFASVIFEAATKECKTAKDLEEILCREITGEAEEQLKEALHNMQCSGNV